MPGRVTAILRHQVDIAEQDAGGGAASALRAARENLVLALGILRGRLQSIETAASRDDIAWLAGAFPDWVSERRLLLDEVQNLRGLLDHIDSLLAGGPS